ncbi:MAG: hypothetical protein OIF38_17035, partial [Cellvibrionaceae bacterium]|nr:hypothetical protein [Cellvibrionaceae bacterium]
SRSYRDDEGNNTGVKDANGNHTQYTYDDLGRVVAINSPASGLEYIHHDNAGNQIASLNASGQKSTLRYDTANRVIDYQSPSTEIKYRYEPNLGLLEEVDNGDSVDQFHYDKEGRLQKHTRQLKGLKKPLSHEYQYNPQGKLSRVKLPDGQILQYTYYSEGEAKGELERISREDWWGASETALLTGIDSNLWDGQQSIGWGNGLRANYQYDDQGRLTSIETKQANNPFDSYRLQYDKKDQISRIDQNNQLNKQQQTYRYDKAGRLTASERSGAQNKSWSYEYDELGNRLKKGGTGNKQALSYGPGNKLLAINQKSLKYNKAGSAELIPSDIGIKRYEYNAEQRPVKFYLNDKLTAEYAYNGFGERVKKTR